MSLILIIVLMLFGGAANADFRSSPWDTTNCTKVTNSCKGASNAPVKPCEHICSSLDAGTCTITVGVLFPKNTSYVVNIGEALAMLELARNDAYTNNILPSNLKVRFETYDDNCEPALSLRATLDAYELCANVFFGPICDYCLAGTGRLSKYLGSYGTPLITPGGFVFDFTTKKQSCDDEMYMVLNSGPLSYEALTHFLYTMVEKYNWKRIALLYEKYDQNEIAGERSCQLMLSSIMESFKNIDNFAYNDGDIQLLNLDYEEYLRREVGVKYGIIVICASHTNTRKVMLKAEEIKMANNGEYVFLNFEMYNDAPVPSKPWYDPEDSEANNERARLAYRSLLTFTPAVEAEHAEQNTTLAAKRGMLYLEGLYDGFMLYSHAVNKTLARGPNGTLAPDMPLRGVDVVSTMFGSSYEGKRGTITMNCNGQRTSRYALMQMNGSDHFQTIALFDTFDNQVETIREIVWVGGEAPSDTPICGFDNSKCPSEINIILIVVCVSSAVLILIFSIFVYRHYKLEHAIASMTWKINYDDINFLDKKARNKYSSNLSLAKRGSQVTLVSEMWDAGSLAGDRQLFTSVAYYKQIRVAVKLLNSNPKLKIELNREQLKEMKVMKDLSNDNLVKFYGASIDRPNRCILTEYCQRGSLQDVLENLELPLDTAFRMSLIQDILKGMLYLHSSDIRSHGSLTSSNCVVDSRFNLKITDFGMTFLRCHAHDDGSCEESDDNPHSYYEKRLWTAPELLRRKDPPLCGTQKGDIYSFGIIVHEIICRQGPFYVTDTQISKQELLENIIYGPARVPSRPEIEEGTSSEEMTDFMVRCWDEDPAARPDFKSLRSIFNKLNSSGNGRNLLDELLTRMEKHANTLETLVDERTADYQEEKRKCEHLLYQLLPKSVAQQLIIGTAVEAESYDLVTIYFSDIVGFTTISAASTPMQVVHLLNDLYTCFDSVIEAFDVYKVETIGDAYMVVSGLPVRNGSHHAREIARMSLALLCAVRRFRMSHRPEDPLRLRIGLHTGPCVAGVVGLKMPRYCLFGDTVNTASRMESNGEALKIHVSAETKAVLDTYGTFDLECRGEIDIKGKGKMTTYWLHGETAPIQHNTTSQVYMMTGVIDEDQKTSTDAENTMANVIALGGPMPGYSEEDYEGDIDDDTEMCELPLLEQQLPAAAAAAPMEVDAPSPLHAHRRPVALGIRKPLNDMDVDMEVDGEQPSPAEPKVHTPLVLNKPLSIFKSKKRSKSASRVTTVSTLAEEEQPMEDRPYLIRPLDMIGGGASGSHARTGLPSAGSNSMSRPPQAFHHSKRATGSARSAGGSAARQRSQSGSATSSKRKPTFLPLQAVCAPATARPQSNAPPQEPPKKFLRPTIVLENEKSTFTNILHLGDKDDNNSSS